MAENPQAEFERLVEEATSKRGAILANLYFDAHGKDKEAVQNALIDLVARITKEKGALWSKGEVQSVIESGDLYSSYTEVKVLTDSFVTLHHIVLQYGPISVEILKPAKIALELDKATAVLLAASQSTQYYTRYIYEKVMPAADRERFEEQTRRRAEFGKQLKEKKPAEGS